LNNVTIAWEVFLAAEPSSQLNFSNVLYRMINLAIISDWSNTYNIAICRPRHNIPFYCYISSWIQRIICTCNDNIRELEYQ
jgi:hypothetical protein